MVSLESAARIIRRPDTTEEQPSSGNNNLVKDDDPFLTLAALLAPGSKAVWNARKRVLDDIAELMRENRWEDIISLYYPVDEKVPDAVKAGIDIPVREKTAFALGHIQRFDDAIRELGICVEREPDNFFTRSSLAYTAYNSLYAAKNKEIFLAGNAKVERIALAHANFRKAQELKPDTVTCFYRQGMLFAQLENKEAMALPLFQRACANWEALSDSEKQERNQEKKNYIKSLYRCASLLLKAGDAASALGKVTLCLSMDEGSNYISLSFKYFALGKVQFAMQDYEKARDALLFAGQSGAGGRMDDFVAELLARTYLALGRRDRALKAVESIPDRLRRPYFRWTEADVLCAMRRFGEAAEVLEKSQARDARSRHKSLIKLAKIHYLLKNYQDTFDCSERAIRFFSEKWGNDFREGLFWKSLAAFRLGRRDEALKIAEDLKAQSRFYPRLDALIAMIRNN